MDFLNQAFAQLRDLFGSMTPGARITATLLLAVVVVSVTYLFNYQLSDADAYLLGGEPIAASDLPAMEAAFGKAGLTDYKTEGSRIRVPNGQHAVYMGALADAGALPPNFGSYFKKAIDSGSSFEGKEQRRDRLRVATQDELSLIIRAMEGIKNASVIYAVEKGRGLSRSNHVTATVSVKPLTGEPLDPKQLTMLRRLVAGAIAGLKAENVTVADLTNGVVSSGGGEDGYGVGSEHPYYAQRLAFEKSFEEKVRGVLSYIPGAIVRASAELDTDIRYTTVEDVHDPKTVPQRTTTVTESTKSLGSSSGGRPGLDAQGPGAGQASIRTSPSQSTEEERNEETTDSLVSTKRETRERIGLTPTKVRITVSIPSSYYEKVWRENNKGEEGEPDPTELSNIEESVRTDLENTIVTLLPSVVQGKDPVPQVRVTTFKSLTPEQIEKPTMTENALAWTGRNWSKASMFGLALFGLVMLRSIVKSASSGPAPSGPTEQPNLQIVSEDDFPEKQQPGDESARVKRKFAKGPSLKEDLADMVRDDPSTAANILSSWISNAG